MAGQARSRSRSPAGTRAAESTRLPQESTDARVSVPIATQINGRRIATQTIHFNLHNESKWMDLCPVLAAHIDDPDHKWSVRFHMGGKDITPAVVREGGFVFVKDQRLWPAATRDITMTLTCNNPTPGRLQSATVRLGLRAHPWSADKVTQTLTIHASVQAPLRALTAARATTPPKS